MPPVAITDHAFAGVSAWAQLGGSSGLRSLREKYRLGKRNTWASIVVCNVAVRTEDEGPAGQERLDSSTFSLFRTHTPLQVIHLRHMLVGRPRRDSKILSNPTT
jgi:hypothetical protein